MLAHCAAGSVQVDDEANPTDQVVYVAKSGGAWVCAHRWLARAAVPRRRQRCGRPRCSGMVSERSAREPCRQPPSVSDLEPGLKCPDPRHPGGSPLRRSTSYPELPSSLEGRPGSPSAAFAAFGVLPWSPAASLGTGVVSRGKSQGLLGRQGQPSTEPGMGSDVLRTWLEAAPGHWSDQPQVTTRFARH